MNAASHVKHINEALAAHGAGPFITTETTGDDEQSVAHGTLGGHAVRVEFSAVSGRPDSDHVVTVVDEASGKTLGTESTGATFADAISSYHWLGALSALGEKE